MTQQISYPDILSYAVPESKKLESKNLESKNLESKIPIKPEEIMFANLGNDKVTSSNNMPNNIPSKFRSVYLPKNSGPLIIHNKRWYFRLVVKKEFEAQKSRALMDDFSLNDIINHLVICFTPSKLPNRTQACVTKAGDPIRIYAFFDSYLEFYTYMQFFPLNERAFYEIIFGEFPQKPHFDIDICNSGTLDSDNDTINIGPNIEAVASDLMGAIITGCMEIFQENKLTFDLTRDLLIFTSHNSNKRSFHLVINNYCHDGNKEAKAFHEAVVSKVKNSLNNDYWQYIDPKVYSPRQQFRLLGSQKIGSNRIKIFHENFQYKQENIKHIYTENIDSAEVLALTQLYESMVSFTSGCKFFPSLFVEKTNLQNNLQILPDLDHNLVEQCIQMLYSKLPHQSPFNFLNIQGHIITLKRLGPSMCPICNRKHEKENPYLFVISGKVYWDCRRSEASTKKFFVGYLAADFTNDNVSEPTNNFLVEDNATTFDGWEFTDGQTVIKQYDKNTPILPVIPSLTPKINSPKMNSPKINNTLDFGITQNVLETVRNVANYKAAKKTNLLPLSQIYDN